MKHRRGIDLVGDDAGYTVKDGSARSSGSAERTYTIEVWSDPPEIGGELLETISRATDFAVSMGAYREAVRQRPGKYLFISMGGSKWDARGHRIHRPLSSTADQAAGSARFKEYEADRMTLAELAEWYVLGGKCSACSHQGWIDRWECARRFGRRAIIVALMPRLRCTACGNRRGNTMVTGKINR